MLFIIARYSNKACYELTSKNKYLYQCSILQKMFILKVIPSNIINTRYVEPVCVVVTTTAVLGALRLVTLTAVTVMEYVVNALTISSPLPCTVILVEALVVLTDPECVLFLHSPSWLAPCV